MLHQQARYVVERRVPKMDPGELAALHSAVNEAAERLSGEVAPITCKRTLYVPSLDRWIAVFEADAPETVERASRIAQLQPGEVHRAIEMTTRGHEEEQ